MTSKAQKKGGYPTELEPLTEETQSFCIIIPAGEFYRNAAYVQLYKLGKWWSWKRDDSGELATQSAMTWRSLFEFNEDCGGSDVATKDDIRDGIYEAMNRLALQVATGQYANIGLSTDEDGTVTPTPEGGEDGEGTLPDDDPETEIDESKAARQGGATEVAAAIELFFDKIDGYYGPVNGTPTYTEAETSAQIISYFPCELVPMEQAITDYYAFRGTNARFLFEPTTAFDTYLFCKGSNRRSFSRWLADVSGFPVSKQVLMSQMANALSDEFWSGYFAEGTETPSTLYREASCEPVQDETLTLNMAGGGEGKTGIVTQKAFHRLLIDISGQATDAATPNVVIDFFYRKNADGTITRESGIGYFTGAGITSGTNPSNSAVPYQTDGHYVFTIDTLTAGALTFLRDNGTLGVGTVGTITITVKDQGEYAL